MKKLVFAAVLACATSAFAVTTTWTGSADGTTWGDGGNWDKGVPTSADTAILTGNFAVTIGSGDAVTVDKLTLDANFTGSLTLAADLTVLSLLDQEAGTFNCGSQALTLGNGWNKDGSFYVHGGVFNAPNADGLLVSYARASGNTQIELKGGTYNANGGTFSARIPGPIQTNYKFTSVDQTFCNLEFVDWNNGTGQQRLHTFGTNTVTGVLKHLVGTMGYSYSGKYRFRVTGDFYAGAKAYGDVSSTAAQSVVLCGTGDQRVVAVKPAFAPNGSIGACSMNIDKPSGKVTFAGEDDSPADFYFGGVFVTTSATEIDMSALRTVAFGLTSQSACIIRDNAQVTWPENTIILPGQGHRFYCNRQQFNNLAITNVAFTRIDIPNGTSFGQTWTGSNVVNGVLSLCHGPLSGASPAFEVKGDFVVGPGTYKDGDSSGGLPAVILTGEGTQTVRLLGKCVSPTLKICKPEGAHVTFDCTDDQFRIGFASGCDACGPLTIKGGVVDMPKNGMAVKNSNGSGIEQTGGKINWGEGPFTVLGTSRDTYLGPLIDNTLDTGCVDCEEGNRPYVVFRGSEINVTNKLVQKRGYLGAQNSGKLMLSGDWIVAPPDPTASYVKKLGNTTCNVTLCGDKVQHYSATVMITNTLANNTGKVIIDKTGGAFVADTPFHASFIEFANANAAFGFVIPTNGAPTSAAAMLAGVSNQNNNNARLKFPTGDPLVLEPTTLPGKFSASVNPVKVFAWERAISPSPLNLANFTFGSTPRIGKKDLFADPDGKNLVWMSYSPKGMMVSVW